MKALKRQRGTTTVEFAIVGLVAILLLFGVIEIARAMFTLNTLTEATRRAVRVAVVCPINDPAIIRAATFGDWTGAPLNLNASNFSVEYLNAAGNVIGNPTGNFIQIRYVRVRITNYTDALIIPILNLSYTAPEFAATLPRESLGIPRQGAVQPC
ncbi:MAG: TadE/TadG family type IV pilus assembly protein [Gammaproteobacteria bacterium]